MKKPGYIDRLKQHPGVPIATMFTVIFSATGLYDRGFEGMAVGALFGSIVWMPVLWTARTQPVSREEEQ